MRNNAPAAVMLAVADFEDLMNELEDLKMEIIAMQRLATMDENIKLVSHEDMLVRYK